MTPKDLKKHSESVDSGKEDVSARERLISTAIQLFVDKGLDGTTTRDIAKAADLNISLISYYFGGKEGLYKTVLTEYAQRMQKESERLLSSLDLQNLTRESFQQLMKTMISQMIPMKFQNLDIHRLLQREMTAGFPYSQDIYENIFRPTLITIVGVYMKAQKKGIIRADVNPSILFFSMVHSVDSYLEMSCCHTVLKEQVLNLPEQMNEYVDQIYKIYVEGVLT